MMKQPLGRVASALLLCLLAAATLVSANPAAAEGGDWRYGVIESYDNPEAATRLGASWTRVRFQWAEVQAEGPDAWVPPIDEETLEAELADGRMVIGLLIGIPDWARDRQRLPEGLYLPYTDPDNTWATFVREAVARYEGQIDHWVIWNEPDIDDPDAPGHTWDGSVEDFAQLLKVAYLAAHEANPDAVIHLGAFTHFWDESYFGRFLDVLLADPEAAAHNHYFDVATAHLYFQPDRIYEVIQAFREDMTSRGLWKPIWLVETNAPPSDDPYWPVPNWTLYVSVYEQAAFIPQALASALAAGAERIAVFKLMDVDGDREANPEPFGLMRQDNSRRPAYDTYRVAIQQLGRAGETVRERWDAVGQIRVDQGDQTTTVLFARLPVAQEATVVATAETAELIDMWGKRQSITAENGVFTVDLQPALCTQTIGDYCMIGGTVLYLVQAKGGNPLGMLPPEDVLVPTRSPAARPAPEATPRPNATGSGGGVAAAPTAPPQPAATGTPTTAAVQGSASTPATSDAVVAGAVAAASATTATTAGPLAELPDSGGELGGLIVLGAGIAGALVLGGWLLYGRRRQ